MQNYFSTQMVKKEHAKIISSELRKRGSKTRKGMSLAKDRSLANLLSLACGRGKYALKIEDIITIGNHEFSINEEGVKELFKHSPHHS
ncbi:hypothetical protein [Oceanospirillum maris]|uniref:hypothetical protein n=1 Tax=Oceanospirillum maris TaxID=64977 RepID=UPI0004854B5A|nr:hypothetical protein [Oceanospirillum maris]